MFLVSSFMFFFYIIGEQEGRSGSAGGLGLAPLRSGGERSRRTV
jgi:hypothetical protein